jgi:hypothetical protein
MHAGRVRESAVVAAVCTAASVHAPCLFIYACFCFWFCSKAGFVWHFCMPAGCLNLNSPQHYTGCSLQLLLLRVPSAAVQTFQKGTEAQRALLALPVLGHRAGCTVRRAHGGTIVVGWWKQLQFVLVTVSSHVHVCAYLWRTEGLLFSSYVSWQRKR